MSTRNTEGFNFCWMASAVAIGVTKLPPVNGRSWPVPGIQKRQLGGMPLGLRRKNIGAAAGQPHQRMREADAPCGAAHAKSLIC